MNHVRWRWTLALLLAGAAWPQDCGWTAPANAQGSTTGRSVTQLALSANGRFLAAGVEDGDYSGLFGYELPSGKLLWKRPSVSGPVALAVSPDGRLLAVAYKIRPKGCPHVELRSAASGEPAAALEDQADLSSVKADSAQAVTFSRSGTLVAAALRNGVRVWNSSTGKNLASIEPPGFETRKGVDLIEDVALAPGGDVIAGTGTKSPSVYLWQVKTGKLLRRIAVGKTPGELAGVVFSPDGALISVGTTGPTRVFRLDGTAICQIPRPAAGPIGPIAFDGNESLWIRGPAGLESWNCGAKGAHRNFSAAGSAGRALEAVLDMDGGGLIGLSTGKEWKTNPSAEEKLVVVDAKTGKAGTTLAVPGRP